MANSRRGPYTAAIVNSAFLKEFFLVLRWRPRIALSGLYWHVTRRRQRARNVLRAALADAPFAYKAWIMDHEGVTPSSEYIELQASEWPSVPTIAVVITALRDSDPERLRRAIGSVRQQSYPHRAIVVVGDDLPADLGTDVALVRVASANPGSGIDLLKAAAEACQASHVMPLSPDDLLAKDALFWIAQALGKTPGARMVYADHDLIDAQGRRCDPWLKPQWNTDQAYAQDFVSPAVVFDRTRVLQSRIPQGAGPAGFALALDMAAGDAGGRHIVHCPRVAVHCRSHPDQVESRPERKIAVARQLEGQGAQLGDGLFGAIDVIWPLPAELPLVTIVVPTRDRLDLLRPCLTSVLGLTDYPRFEVIVVDNGSTQTETLAYFAELAGDPRVRVVRDDRPYNFAALNNAAFRGCRGDVLCMLNNDTEVISPGWLTAMVRHAVRPHVGAVGAKLLYADRTLQHAGVVIGMGCAAGHAHRNLSNDDPGYFLQPHIQRRATAVTAACLVVERDKFERVGGLDEETFAIAFNDVDFCLKLDAAGLTNIYEPNAVLWHYESQSRERDNAPGRREAFDRELSALQQRWGTRQWVDAMHHPGLDRLGESYRLGFDAPDNPALATS